MLSPLVRMIDRLDTGMLPAEPLLDWSCPVPFFGDALSARVATVGINPSNLEFVDRSGYALVEEERRLPTLQSLGVTAWSDVSSLELDEILLSCRNYFRHKPYRGWFGVLERVVANGGATFYGERPTACHLDLVPYATRVKWGSLAPPVQIELLDATADMLGTIVRDSSVGVLVLNGHSVVNHFRRLIDSQLRETRVPDWDLPRTNGRTVAGVAYEGFASIIGGVHLETQVAILGYNHNLQSSFGVTRQVIESIADWVSTAVAGAFR